MLALVAAGCARWTDASISFTDTLQPRYEAQMNRENQAVNNVALTVDTGAGPQSVPSDQILSTGDKFRTYRYEPAASVPAGTPVSATWVAQFSGSSDSITRTAIPGGPFDVLVSSVEIIGIGGTQVTQTATNQPLSDQQNPNDYSWIGGQPVRVRVTLQNLGPNPTPPGSNILLQWPATSNIPNMVLVIAQSILPGQQIAAQTSDGITTQISATGFLVATYDAPEADTNASNDFFNTSIFVTP